MFSHVVKGRNVPKFGASIRLHFEDTKRLIPFQMRPKGFGTVEKRALIDPLCSFAGAFFVKCACALVDVLY